MIMSKMYVTSDLHLGHRNVARYRKEFNTPEDHDNTVFENLATTVGKRDSLWILGDAAFSVEWLAKIKLINCKSKVLILGNHDLERGIKMIDLVGTYDKIYSLHSKRNMWFSHCPIHPEEMRDRIGNIHGHSHGRIIEDKRYFNVCLEHTEYKPVLFSTIMDQFKELA